MVWCDLRALKVVLTAGCALWALGGCGSCGLSSSAGHSSGPTQAQLASAKLDGHWKLTVVVDSYSGPAPPKSDQFQPGHRGVDEVVLVTACAPAGQCTLQVWGPDGPDQSQASFFRLYSNTTSFEGPPVSTPMTESGASYSQAIPISGLGGFTCPPSPTVRAPEQRLTITVAAATGSGSAWTASSLTGAETLDAGWGCSNGAFSGWTVGHLKITGVRG
jgi:hypothetical protein